MPSRIEDLRLKDFGLFNIALLGKSLWRFVSEEDNL